MGSHWLQTHVMANTNVESSSKETTALEVVRLT